MAGREEKTASHEAKGRMLCELRAVAARGGDVQRISGLSLIALLCVSAVAPVALVGQSIGPAIAAWLATAGSIGSNEAFSEGVHPRGLRRGLHDLHADRGEYRQRSRRGSRPGAWRPHPAGWKISLAAVRLTS